MDASTLVKMANQIGEFFESMPDRTEAVDGIATHIQRYWEPRMRRALFRYVDAPEGGVELKAIVLDAVTQNRARLEPAAAGPG